jgi:hypothetical protein
MKSTEETTMANHDVTKTNLAVEKLLEVTTNPRHRFLLQVYYRHRYLEIAGRYEEIFVPEMMSANPAYHMHASQTSAALNGTGPGKKPLQELGRDPPVHLLRGKRGGCGCGPLYCFVPHRVSAGRGKIR